MYHRCDQTLILFSRMRDYTCNYTSHSFALLQIFSLILLAKASVYKFSFSKSRVIDRNISQMHQTQETWNIPNSVDHLSPECLDYRTSSLLAFSRPLAFSIPLKPRSINFSFLPFRPPSAKFSQP